MSVLAANTNTPKQRLVKRPAELSKKDVQNIQVAVRCRPISDYERKKLSTNIVDCSEERHEVCIRSKNAVGSLLSKLFYFDNVFGPLATQLAIYEEMVQPLVEEVLQGYNCTIFAYGQTGTGKTYTMEGCRSGQYDSWEQDPYVGIVPRALAHLFDVLTEMSDIEFTVRVSYIELYNEELFDLLAPGNEDLKLRIFEDVQRKGSVIVTGLTEMVVASKAEVHDILEKGAHRRQVAATLLNASSSRSHTVFTVVVHIKENSPEGEELVKIGKLNLVDLAGSENIGRSGAVNQRAREAGQINQSLLTLGRCINNLVEHASHIPYRESKLTRLLQDSLGGRTKTAIIATISPSSLNYEETLSTLDYAHRAKDVTNKPEVNMRVTKKTLLKAYTEEIERLRRDLEAQRTKTGIFVAKDNYEALTTELELHREKVEELTAQIDGYLQEIQKLNDLFAETNDQLKKTRVNLKQTERQLAGVQTHLAKARRQRNERHYLADERDKFISVLRGEAEKLQDVATQSRSEVYQLQDRVERERETAEKNRQMLEDFGARFGARQLATVQACDRLLDSASTALSTARTKVIDAAARQHRLLTDGQAGLTETCLLNDRNFTSISQLLNGLQENVAHVGCDTATQLVSEVVQELCTKLVEFHSELNQRLGEMGELQRSLQVEASAVESVAVQTVSAVSAGLSETKQLLRENNQAASQLATSHRQALEAQRKKHVDSIAAQLKLLIALNDDGFAEQLSLMTAQTAELDLVLANATTQHCGVLDDRVARPLDTLNEHCVARVQEHARLGDQFVSLLQTTTNDSAKVHDDLKQTILSNEAVLKQSVDSLRSQVKSTTAKMLLEAEGFRLGLSGKLNEQKLANDELAKEISAARKDVEEHVAASAAAIAAEAKAVQTLLEETTHAGRQLVSGEIVRETEPSGNTPKRHIIAVPEQLPHQESTPVVLGRLRTDLGAKLLDMTFSEDSFTAALASSRSGNDENVDPDTSCGDALNVSAAKSVVSQLSDSQILTSTNKRR